MALIRGIKNKKGVSEPEIQSQDEHEIVTDKPQSSRFVEIEALKREVSALTEALEKQQWLNLVEPNRVDPFENPFAKLNHRQQGGEKHCMRASIFDSRCARGPPIHHSQATLTIGPSRILLCLPPRKGL